MAKLTLKIKKQPQKNLKTNNMGYFSRAIANGVVDFDELCERASANTTMHPAELGLAFKLALDAVRDALVDGNIVVLDQIGRLYPAVQSKWTEKADDQKLDSLKPHVNFRPAQAITAAIGSAKLAWATDKEAADAEKNGTVTEDDTRSSSDSGSTSGGSSSDSGSSSGGTSGGGSSGGSSGSGSSSGSQSGEEEGGEHS